MGRLLLFRDRPASFFPIPFLGNVFVPLGPGLGGIERDAVFLAFAQL